MFLRTIFTRPAAGKKCFLRGRRPSALTDAMKVCVDGICSGGGVLVVVVVVAAAAAAAAAASQPPQVGLGTECATFRATCLLVAGMVVTA